MLCYRKNCTTATLRFVSQLNLVLQRDNGAKGAVSVSSCADDRQPAAAPNDCRSMDWMYDEFFDGRRLRVLTIVDNLSRVGPGIWVGRQAKANDVVDAFRVAIAELGRAE